MATSHPKPDIFAFIREDVFILPSASLISKEAFDIIGGFDTMLSGYEDDDLFLRMFQSGYEHRYIDMPLSKWRIHTTSSSYTGRMAKSRNIYMRKLIDMFPDDVKRSRYYRRDLIAPRFYPPLMGNLLAAAKARDRNAVTYNITELNHVIQYSPLTKKKMIMKLTLVILSRPLLADLAWHIRKPFRFIMIRFVR